MMNLDAYLARIGLQRPLPTNLDTLTAVHRAHLTAISYENLDIHLGRRLGLDLAQIYDKIVVRGRGGWCYEMNSLLGWALRELGFDVMTLGAAVGVETEEDRQHMDHMVLSVLLDGERYLIDAGFGNAFLDPFPLREGSYQQAYHTFKLHRDGDYWHFTNHAHGGPGFDFLLQARTTEEFASRCDWLQTSPDSGFVQRAVAHRLLPDYSMISLRGAVLTTINEQGKSQQVIETLDAYRDTITQRFGLRLSDAEIEQLWAKVWSAHQAWVQSTSS
jgi:N-hydroxyarylamine O-acetyltransferase